MGRKTTTLTLTLIALAQMASATDTPAGQEPPEQEQAEPAEPRTDPAARALLEAMQARLGSGRLRSLRATAKARWQGMPGEGTQREVYAQPPLAARVELDFPSFGRFAGGSDGAIVWERSPLGLQVRSGWDASEVLRRFGRALHVHWTELYAGARDAGELELDGRSCRRLELTPRMLAQVDPRLPERPAPPPDVLLLDARTKLPARLTVHTRGADGGETTAETRFADWREVGGHRFPHHVELRVSGFVLILDYERYELDVELPEGLFEPGAEVRAAQTEQDAAGGFLPEGEVRRMTLNERHIASIRMTCKHSEIQKTLSVLLPEVLGHVMSTGAEKTGPPLVRYHSVPAEEIDLEAAIPVRAPIEPAGRVKACTLPAGEAAVTWHVGPYQQLGAAYERLQGWMAERGYEPAAACWEEYWTDPGLEPDPSKWRTRVVWPVRKARAGDDDPGGGEGDDGAPH